jgi:hypothetical protein
VNACRAGDNFTKGGRFIMTREEMDRILGVEGKEIWQPDYDYGEMSEEENEELTRLLESLTEDDLQPGEIVRVNRYDPSDRKVIYVNEAILQE